MTDILTLARENGFSHIGFADMSALEPLEARDHTENIRTLAERKFGRLSFDDYAQKSKAFAYLYRCGYESADITDTISKMEQEEREWL